MYIKIIMMIAGACLGFQLPEIANAIGGGKVHVPLLVNIMTAIGVAALFVWMAS